MRLVKMWLAMRNLGHSTKASGSLLPRSGGYAEQQALAMDAFALFDKWLAQRQGNQGDARNPA